MTTTVISLRGRIREYGPRLELAPANLVYVGRRCSFGGWDLPAHPLANPFPVRKNSTSGPAVAKYIRYLIRHPELVEQARKLEGSVLACWCMPSLCHGHVVAGLADGMTIAHLTNRAEALKSAE